MKLRSLFDEIGNDLEISEEALAQLMDVFKESGFIFKQGAESTSNLSDGIKSITEDTANLLASYLNAIRADVSFSKTQQTAMTAAVKSILGLLPASPTLSDYLASIEANTYNSASAVREILTELRNVITTEGGGAAIRAYI